MRISIIGTGNMGSAIARALSTTDHEVCVFDAVQEKAEELARECETIKLLPSIKSASGSDAVILAVKPQILPGLYQMLREVETDLWISIAAGVPLSVLEDHLGTGNVIRFMPNIAASAKKAVTAIAAGNGVADQQHPGQRGVIPDVTEAPVYGFAAVKFGDDRFNMFRKIEVSEIFFQLQLPFPVFGRQLIPPLPVAPDCFGIQRRRNKARFAQKGEPTWKWKKQT